MAKLLVNAPTGQQEIIEVGEGGGYFDAARVLWDEREDGPLPAVTLGGMVREGAKLVFSQARMDEHIASVKPPVPQTVTRRQARQALLLAGLLDDVPTAIAAIPDEIQRRMAQIEWEDSLEFVRSRPLVIQISAALGLSEAELDEMFVTASTL